MEMVSGKDPAGSVTSYPDQHAVRYAPVELLKASEVQHKILSIVSHVHLH